MRRWSWILCGLLGSSAMANQVDLMRCVSELNQIRPSDNDRRLFYSNSLLVGSLRVSDGGKTPVWLVVGHERGTLIFPLREGRLNRFRFEMPNRDPRRLSDTYFISYSHSEVFGSRLVLLSPDILPPGQAPSDFDEVQPLVVSNKRVQEEVGRLIGEEIESLQRLHSQRRLGQRELLAGNLSLCRNLRFPDPALSRRLDRTVNELEMVSTERFQRIPAAFR